MVNFISQIIPWELTIKEIESQFGTVVASYFTFLRWLFWVNLVISVLLAAFVVIPEVFTSLNFGRSLTNVIHAVVTVIFVDTNHQQSGHGRAQDVVARRGEDLDVFNENIEF